MSEIESHFSETKIGEKSLRKEPPSSLSEAKKWKSKMG